VASVRGGGDGAVLCWAAGSEGGGTGAVVTGAGGGTEGCVGGSFGAFGSFDSFGSFALRSAASCAAFSRASRACLSRSAASLAAASSCAFWPPLSGTIEPIFGPLRVSSTGATAASYGRPALAGGSEVLAGTCRSAPGRTFAVLAGVLLSNQPQPASKGSMLTPTRT
jgi:hypothetical protein